MAGRTEKLGKSVIVYDDTLIDHLEEDLFQLSRWPDAPVVPGYSGGRGKTLFIEHDRQHWVLRHYHRGGVVGRFLNDEFLFLGHERTRPIMEWQLLDRIYAAGLPVPQPVAARYVRRGLIYSADLISVRLPNVEPLSSHLRRERIPENTWRHVGETVALFHRANIYHADLTAHNIQIDNQGQLYLLDFDRGRIMHAQGSWMADNMSRLKRSLTKISAGQEIEFTDRQWAYIQDAYRSQLAA